MSIEKAQKLVKSWLDTGAGENYNITIHNICSILEALAAPEELRMMVGCGCEADNDHHNKQHQELSSCTRKCPKCGLSCRPAGVLDTAGKTEMPRCTFSVRAERCVLEIGHSGPCETPSIRASMTSIRSEPKRVMNLNLTAYQVAIAIESPGDLPGWVVDALRDWQTLHAALAAEKARADKLAAALRSCRARLDSTGDSWLVPEIDAALNEGDKPRPRAC